MRLANGRVAEFPAATIGLWLNWERRADPTCPHASRTSHLDSRVETLTGLGIFPPTGLGTEAATAPRGEREDIAQSSSRRTIVLAGTTYAILALLVYWPILPWDNSRLPLCACGDAIQGVWFLHWTPFALLHGHNPFLTNYFDYPGGVNLAQNTSMPLLGILSAPIRWLFGPVAALNAMLWLAFPASATACFFALRRWVLWSPAAFIGGLLYGFSPYMIGQGIGHLNLLFVPGPPLILLTLDELVVRRRWRPRTSGIVLGLVAGAQFLISPEVFAGTAVLAAIGLMVLMIANPHQIGTHAKRVAIGLSWALLVCGALIAYPVYLELTGPDRFVGSAHGTYPFPADLLSPIIPDANQLVAPRAWAQIGDRFIMGDYFENGGYLGAPFLLFLTIVVVQLRRRKIILFSGIMAAIAGILSLGPRLTIDGHTTALLLPMAVLDHLPLVVSFIDARFALYVVLFAAVILAVWIDRFHEIASDRIAAHVRAQTHRTTSIRKWPSVAVGGVVVVAVLAPMIPKLPYPSQPTEIPKFFSTSEGQRIATGSVALTYPYPNNGELRAMLWQSTAAMRFKLIGGYALGAGSDGKASYDSPPRYLPSVPATLVAFMSGGSPAASEPGSRLATPSQMRAFLVHYKIAAVLSQSVGANPAAANALFAAAIGFPATRTGGMYVRFDVQRSIRAVTRASG